MLLVPTAMLSTAQRVVCPGRTEVDCVRAYKLADRKTPRRIFATENRGEHQNTIFQTEYNKSRKPEKADGTCLYDGEFYSQLAAGTFYDIVLKSFAEAREIVAVAADANDEVAVSFGVSLRVDELFSRDDVDLKLLAAA